MRITAATLFAAALAACGDATAAAPSEASFFETSTPAAEGVDATALAALVANSAQQQSDAVIIVRNGKVVYENHFGRPDSPIYGASVSKSFVSLAYGYLLADGKLASLDEKVVKYLPSFADNDPLKAQITLRMLLNHTSGLKAGQAGTVGLSVETYAIQERLVFAPGTSWQYLNAGADLAGALVAHIGGEAVDKLIQRKLFSPLGITTAYWDHDRTGVPYASGAFGGLHIKPMDLAKVGQVILDGGKWRDTQLIPADYIALAESQSQDYQPDYGLFWWRAQNATGFLLTNELLDLWQGVGLTTSITDKLRPIVGTSYPSLGQLNTVLQSTLSATELGSLSYFLANNDHVAGYRVLFNPALLGMYFNGYEGQYLFVVPSKHLVAVRMRQYTQADIATSIEQNANPSFLSDAYRLVPSAVADYAANLLLTSGRLGVLGMPR